MIVQIYGFTTVADMEAVAGLGIDHVGVVVDEGIDTWDSVDPSTARALARARPGGTKLVALSLSSDPARIRETVHLLDPDIVHLARVVDDIDPTAVAAVRRSLAPVEVMTTIPVRDHTSVDTARRFAECSDWLLLDTAHPDTGVVGATGHTHDWRLSRDVVAAVDVPVILAGGLGPENVAEAIEVVRPAGVDSETRTSTDADRRRKDPVKVRAFVERARQASVGLA